MSVQTSLPPKDDVSERGTWFITDRHGGSTTLEGIFLGFGASYRPRHNHTGDYAPKRQHCSTCRWTELRIFKNGTGRYLVVSRGATIVPGEIDFVEYDLLRTAFEVVEKVTTRRTGDDGRQEVFLTYPASQCLAQAAGFDRDMREAYVNRATP